MEFLELYLGVAILAGHMQSIISIPVLILHEPNLEPIKIENCRVPLNRFLKNVLKLGTLKRT